ncbi:hypothetical protein Dsin_014970 [Dipteronia sinensis]|uniref:Uncharacterized protein n=1 Tax=Dipteronia sinensis TaxID=43782 RepID=A0AAE0ANL2_9ROSI|nr:hypothetical protein Dsin_014970 [Dipteronia sinensis]
MEMVNLMIYILYLAVQDAFYSEVLFGWIKMQKFLESLRLLYFIITITKMALFSHFLCFFLKLFLISKYYRASDSRSPNLVGWVLDFLFVKESLLLFPCLMKAYNLVGWILIRMAEQEKLYCFYFLKYSNM